MSKEGAELRKLSESIDALSLKSDAEEYGKIMDALANQNDEFTRLAEETQTHVSHITEVMEMEETHIFMRVMVDSQFITSHRIKLQEDP